LDFLVIDAFSSDAIPVHLLTREAFELYDSSTKRSGLIAVHVSNRHFNLVPLVTKLGESVGLETVTVLNAIPLKLSEAAMWVFLSHDADRIRSLGEFADSRRVQMGLAPEDLRTWHPSALVLDDTPLWTTTTATSWVFSIPYRFDLAATEVGLIRRVQGALDFRQIRAVLGRCRHGSI
jgi:hypothetical protein